MSTKTEKNENITEALNQVYATEPSTLEPEIVKMQVLSLNNASRISGIDKGKVIILPDFDEPLKEFDDE